MRPIAALALWASSALLFAQEVKPKDVRELGKNGSAALPRFEELLKHPNTEVRVEVVKQITELHTQRSVDLLILATKDNDPEVQVRATDGLVNFYIPGYVQTGFSANLKRAGVLNVTVLNQDGAAGLPAEEPFDVILLSGSVAAVPQALLNQLKVGGRLAAIVGGEPVMRAVLVTRKGANDFSREELFDTVAGRLPGFAEASAFSF